MRIAIAVLVSSLLGSSVCFASQTTMWWWQKNGDSIVLDGVTISLSGIDIESDGGRVRDPFGPDDAYFMFTFSPPIASFQMFVNHVSPAEEIQFFAPFPNFVSGVELDPTGSPVQFVRGFFPGDTNRGSITWQGPLTSVSFTMAGGDGSIDLTQMGQAFSSSQGNVIELRATPDAGGVTLSLAISDAAHAAPGVQGFLVQRSALYPCNPDEPPALVHCVLSRQAGTVSHTTILDTGVHPNTYYAYRVLGWSTIPCFPDADQSPVVANFDPTGWGYEIVSFAGTGAEPAPIAHGRLISAPGYEANWARVVSQCDNSCNAYEGWALVPDVSQYLDTGTEVLVYGSVGWAGNAYGYVASFLAATPRSCALAVERSSWSHVKKLYRAPGSNSR